VAIREKDVAVLIPTYRRREMVVKSVRSALQTGAGEIIVSDDCSGDGTVETLAEIRDPRLRVIAQSNNLGLWGNHLALLRSTTYPWVKFLQDDDRIRVDGLGVMAEHCTTATAVVSALPFYQDHASGATHSVFELSRPRRWTSDQYMQRLLFVGNELGTPTCTMYRADALDRHPSAWSNEVSADLLANVLCASRGEVALLPHGPVQTIVHNNQDGVTQGFGLAMIRLRNSLAYLGNCPDPRIRRFSRVFAVVEGLGTARSGLSWLARGQSLYGGYLRDLSSILGHSCAYSTLEDLKWVCRMLKRKYGRRIDLRLDDDE
jgi:glycosyltransferase involved in cell wall biosynthesis